MINKKKDGKRVIVIGAGAAGMLAAAVAAENGAGVTLLEKNEKCGKKIYITGKGRCNVTNTAEGEDFFANIPRNHRFLMSSFARFSGKDMMNYLEGAGLRLKVERGGRVFPESDRASDVTRALIRQMERFGVDVRLNTRVLALETNEGRVSLVKTDKGDFFCDAVIVCTGGRSYSATGSTGDGWLFAQSAGLRTNPALPSLVPLETNETWPHQLQGLTLKNVVLSAVNGKKTIFSQQGEMLFTHFGIGGPLALSLSAVITGMDLGKIRLSIDMKPALDEQTLEERIIRDFEKNLNRQVDNAMAELLPRSMIPVALELADVPQNKPVNQVSKRDRLAILKTLKAMPLTVKALRPLDEAVVTRGGVHVSEIDPRTMESKKVAGLFFAGEVIDVDGFTGGFNLQIAFSTAYSAAVGVMRGVSPLNLPSGD